ncbi:hypothetical protein [Sulfurimonas sp.]
MDAMKILDYKGYEFKYDLIERVELKDDKELNLVNEALDAKEPSELSWYLDDEKRVAMRGKAFRVTNAISWHMGLPYYVVEDLDNREDMYVVGEFYLQKIKG